MLWNNRLDNIKYQGKMDKDESFIYAFASVAKLFCPVLATRPLQIVRSLERNKFVFSTFLETSPDRFKSEKSKIWGTGNRQLGTETRDRRQKIGVWGKRGE